MNNNIAATFYGRFLVLIKLDFAKRFNLVPINRYKVVIQNIFLTLCFRFSLFILGGNGILLFICERTVKS